jgi:Bacterial PH domain
MALGAALVVIVGAVLLGIALPAPFKGGDQVGVAILGLPVAAVLLMLARPSVTASAGGLVVRNLIGTRRLSWAEVVAIRLGPHDSWASIDVADGTTLPMMAVQTADREHAAEALADLQARLVIAEAAAADG